MTVPLCARAIAAVIGGLLVLTAWASVIRTLIVPRSGGRLARQLARLVNAAFRLATAPIADYQRRDRVLASQAAAILLTLLGAWLGIALGGCLLLMWPLVHGGLGTAFSAAGSSLFCLGYAEPAGAPPAAAVFTAAVTGVVFVTLQIAYLPTLYAAFNRRETEVALLNARAGVPSWGPELLARTHYALRGGPISLGYEDFRYAVERLRAVDFPIERDPAEAWPDFVGWRAAYEQAAYAIAAEIDAVPALWSGPRRHGDPAIPPHRPPAGLEQLPLPTVNAGEYAGR